MDFVGVVGHDRHANGDGQFSGHQALEAPAKFLVGARLPGNPLVRRLGRAVDGDVELAEARLPQPIGDLGCDQRGIREEVENKPTAFRVLEDVVDIRPDEEFASAEADRGQAEVRALIKNGKYFRSAQLVRQDPVRGIVAMDASEIAPVGQLERRSFGHPSPISSGSHRVEKLFCLKMLHDGTNEPPRLRPAKYSTTSGFFTKASP